MKKVHCLLGHSLLGLFVLGTSLVAPTADVAALTSVAPTALSIEEEITIACTTRQFDYLDDQGTPLPIWQSRVEIYCTKTPPPGWVVRGVLDVRSAYDDLTPWITETDWMLLHQWQQGDGVETATSSIRGTRLEILNID